MHGGGLELALVFLLAAVIAVPVFKRFGLGAVLGYLAAGVLLGPYALRVVPDPEPVLTASANELPAAPKPKCCASSGSTGCTQYNKANVAKPPENSASTVRMNIGVPFSMYASLSCATTSSRAEGGVCWASGATAGFTGDLGEESLPGLTMQKRI